jgi:hypothetical protein
MAFVGLTFVVLPYYLIKSRGLKKGAGAIGISVLIYLLYSTAVLIGIIVERMAGI